ncbi:MAG: hypothetical protein GXY52_09030 [Chloroflexi bacterium]|nr:hypothetical protein [Chloroflexota bacterium]
MASSHTRWRDLPDKQRAKQILLVVFWSAIVVLYMLGAFGWLLRRQYQSAFEAPTPTVTATATAGSSEPTLFPTLTPDP